MVEGLKDWVGCLWVEIYLVVEGEFFVDDNVLVLVGKIFCCVVILVLVLGFV